MAALRIYDYSGHFKPIWWLSFVDPDKDVCLGVCIVQAVSIEDAVQRAWQLEINPGGEVLGCAIKLAELADMNRLLTPEEATELLRKISYGN